MHNKDRKWREMKILAVNGSPRKGWNTSQMLESVLKGAASLGAETELVNLYELEPFTGCRSCFACKYNNESCYGKCGWQDGLTPLLEKIKTTDAFVLGSPVYLSDVSSGVRALIERMIFPVFQYTNERKSLVGKKIACGLILTMNVPRHMMVRLHYNRPDGAFGLIQRFLGHFYGSCEMLCACDTYQFDNYADYVCTMFDAGHKAEMREKQFPKDLQKAFDLGKLLINQAEKHHK